MFRGYILFVFCFISVFLIAQNQSIDEVINAEINSFPAEIKENLNFKKAHHYYLEHNHDSALIYSHVFLDTWGKEDKYSAYCHYFSGVSFMRKSVYLEAQKSFYRIPESFSFYFAVQMHLAAVSIELEEFDKALRLLLELEKRPDITLIDFKKSVIFHDIGICYLHLETFDKAEEYLLKSTALQEKAQDTSLIIGAYIDLANIYYVQYKDDLAIPYFEKAYQLSEKVSDYELKQVAALNMAVVEENRGNLSLSLHFRKEYEQWNDSLNDQNKVWEIAEQEKKFIAEQKQKEIKILEKDNALKLSQRNSFIYSSILLLLLALTFIYFYSTKRKINKVILAQKAQLDVLNSTKDKLFSIVSHDLRSSVNALKRGNDKISSHATGREDVHLQHLIQTNSAITNSTHNLLDNMLNWALLQSNQLYFLLEELNLLAVVDQVVCNYKPILDQKNIVLKLSISSETYILADLESIKIVLRNVLDNAIKFSKSADEISIYSEPTLNRKCTLIIEDQGPGMDESVLNDFNAETEKNSNKTKQGNSGLGLQLCQDMIAKNKGNFKIETAVGIGTKIRLEIPVIG